MTTIYSRMYSFFNALKPTDTNGLYSPVGDAGIKNITESGEYFKKAGIIIVGASALAIGALTTSLLISVIAPVLFLIVSAMALCALGGVAVGLGFAALGIGRIGLGLAKVAISVPFAFLFHYKEKT